MSKKVISIVLCLALVVALAVPALAATTTLYSRTNAGYRITGTATISGTTARSTMTASEVSGTPLKPLEEYSNSSIYIVAYNKSGKWLGTASNSGYPTLTASYYSNGDSVGKIEVRHVFNYTTYGTYTVNA